MKRFCAILVLVLLALLADPPHVSAEPATAPDAERTRRALATLSARVSPDDVRRNVFCYEIDWVYLSL